MFDIPHDLTFHAVKPESYKTATNRKISKRRVQTMVTISRLTRIFWKLSKKILTVSFFIDQIAIDYIRIHRTESMCRNHNEFQIH